MKEHHDNSEHAAEREAVTRVVDRVLKGVADGADARAQVAGFVAGVKPAVLWGFDEHPDKNGVLEALREAGMEAEIVGRLLVNPAAIMMRVAEEPELAAECGWDAALPAIDNVKRASSKWTADAQFQMLMGFVLGFPESAIRHYADALPLEKNGVPLAEDLAMSVVPDGDARFKKFADGLTGDERTTLWEYGAARLDMLAELEGAPTPRAAFDHEVDLERQLGAAYRGRLSAIYGRRFGLTEAENRIILDRYVEYVFEPAGRGRVYYFAATLDRTGNPPADVLALREKVAKAFRDKGF